MAEELFKFLEVSNTDEGYRFVDNLSPEALKSIPPYVLLGWGHGARKETEAHAILTNDMLNPYVFSLSKHPKLLLKLFVAANSNMGHTRYSFVKSVGKDETPLLRRIARYYDTGMREAKEIRPMLSDTDIQLIKEMYTE